MIAQNVWGEVSLRLVQRVFCSTLSLLVRWHFNTYVHLCSGP